ncbi:MAG TPA: M20/M25/M40 family metallo-hydrolase [Gaiellaceae bacterium]|nr:M20/M25/M40 family metallo-hydrolase [Gaiellaceae bacterium]
MPAAQALRGWLEDERGAMVELLELLAAAESPTLEPQSQRAPLALLAAELERAGLVVRTVRGTEVGHHLYARPRRRGAPYQLLLGHVDTVWPRGTLASMPLRQEGGLLFGPGVIDMKGGLVVLVFALRALAELGLEPAVTPVVFVNTDEEIGSPDSTRWLRLLARSAVRAFVLEAAEGSDGKLKIARKGLGRFTVTVHGRAAHAGTSFEEGVSAILELSTQVQRLFALNDPGSGVTVNVGTIDGGLRANVVAPRASAVVGVRAPTAEAAQRLEASIRALEPTLPGAVVEVEGGFDGRPPMEPSARNRALLGTAVRLGHKLGVFLEDAGLVGGGSDANTTSLYTATLDGLGPRGDGSHAAHEHVVVASLPERAALLALLLLEPAEAPAARTRRRRAAARITGGSGAHGQAGVAARPH